MFVFVGVFDIIVASGFVFVGVFDIVAASGFGVFFGCFLVDGGIVHEDGTLENAIVDMKKTQLKKSRLWLSMMMMQKHNGKTMPSFASTYRLKSVEDGNDKGSWGSWSIALEGAVPSMEAYTECRELHASISSGEIRILPPSDPTIQAIQDIISDDVPF